jgi:hypothetical protein
MSKTVTFNVHFHGYMATIAVPKDGQQIAYATLDFISGCVTLNADGGCVRAPKIADLKPLLLTCNETSTISRK